MAGGAFTAFVFNDATYIELTRSTIGPVARDLDRRGIRVEAAAKGFASGQGGGPRVRTGRLRSSITHELGSDGISVYCDVGTNTSYGGYVELGTDRSRPYPYLRPALRAGFV
jgi:hypothetical protein